MTTLKITLPTFPATPTIVPKERVIVSGSFFDEPLQLARRHRSRWTYRPDRVVPFARPLDVPGDVVGELPHLGDERRDHQRGE